MINKENIQQEVDKILESLDGINRAAANPFLFTRIRARMNKQSGWEKVTFLLSRPVIAFAILVAVVGINALAVFGTKDQELSQEKGSLAITDIAEEYNMVANNNYYYENIPGE